MDLNRMLGALLGGAAQPPKRRRRSTRAPARPRSTEAQLGQALGSIAAAAVEALLKRTPAEAPVPVPPPPRMPAPSRSRAPARERERERPWGETAPAESRPAPTAGRGPWAGAAARPAPPPAPEPEPGPSAEEAEALLLVRAMVAAAKADGTIDAAERRGIAAQLDAAGLSAEERDFVLADFERPMTPEALAREATDAMLRARLYAAAVAAMGEVSPPERAWLDRLAAALKLDRAAAAAIEERLAG